MKIANKRITMFAVPKLIKSLSRVLFLLLVTVFLSVVSVQKVNAQQVADLIFYEGNGCTQDIVFTYNSYQAANDNCKKSGSCKGDNDEARSLRIAKSVNPNARIVVYDSPGGDTTDDYTVIDIVNRQFMQPEGYCLPTFENNFSNPNLNSGIQVDYIRKNNLDGKVSRVQVIPNRVVTNTTGGTGNQPQTPPKNNGGNLPPICAKKPDLPQCN